MKINFNYKFSKDQLLDRSKLQDKPIYDPFWFID